jgi:hypothetical protein
MSLEKVLGKVNPSMLQKLRAFLSSEAGKFSQETKNVYNGIKGTKFPGAKDLYDNSKVRFKNTPDLIQPARDEAKAELRRLMNGLKANPRGVAVGTTGLGALGAAGYGAKKAMSDNDGDE